jgi:hypothetical protein
MVGWVNVTDVEAEPDPQIAPIRNRKLDAARDLVSRLRLGRWYACDPAGV